MKRKKSIWLSLMAIALLFVSNTVNAGIGMVKFGAHLGGNGCSGTGICKTGAIGTEVNFVYHEFTDSAAHGNFSSLTMTFDYDEALLYGFMGGTRGGSYTFTGGYTFDHPEDKNLGVPSTYSIPDGYLATLEPVDAKGKTKLIITQFIRFQK